MAARDNQFGRYRLVGLMASGGMSRLDLAVMTGVDGFSRVVALKRVLPQYARSREFLRMFVNEAQLAARLDHPNVVRIYELGEIDEQHFISMEYLPGEDLAQILRRCKRAGKHIPTRIAASIGQGVAEALFCAHELADDDDKKIGLVHRDVSLSNVLVTYHGVTKLADFGIAKATQSSESSTRAGVFKGKFAYASPEQVTGRDLDARTDIFALGIVLWETIALKRLFKRSNDAATINAVEKAVVPSLRTIRPDVAPELDEIVMKALARKPQDRWQNAQDLADALEEAQRTVVGRATARDRREWLEELFGSETATLKRRIAQGRGLEKLADDNGILPSYQARLRLRPVGNPAWLPPEEEPQEELSDPKAPAGGPEVLDISDKGASSAPTSSPSTLPRAAWSVSSDGEESDPTRAIPDANDHPSVSMFSDSDWQNIGSDTRTVPPAEAQKLSMRWLFVGAGAGALFLVLVVAVLVGRTTAEPEPTKQILVGAGTGELAVSSVPASATIVVDGHSSGLVTPAVLKTLPTNRRVRVRLEKEGYASAVVDLQLSPSRRTEEVVTLQRVSRLSFSGVDQEASIFVDDVPVDHDQAVELDPGEHHVRVEVDGEVVFDKLIVAKPGDQTIDLGT
jgi:serine/threonine protein kinase